MPPEAERKKGREEPGVSVVSAVFSPEIITLKAHRNVLCARSTYFDAMFNSDCREATTGVIRLGSDTSVEAMKLVLKFLYTSTIDLTNDIVVNVMKISHRYQLTDLYDRCMEYCKEIVDATVAVEWLVASHSLVLEDLEQLVMTYLKWNFRKVQKLGDDEPLKRLCCNQDVMLEVLKAVEFVN